MAASHHIIMADIISSRHIHKNDDFMHQFKALVKLANTEFAHHIISPLTITLGDEFQGIVNSTKTLFDLLFFLEEQIIEAHYPYGLRYSLVFGEIETEINKEIAYEMYGPGLTRAREALTTAKETGDNYFIAINEHLDDQLRLCMKLYQSIKSEWKLSEFEIVSAFLKHKDYKDLKRIGLYKTRSGAWKKGKSLRIDEYNIVKQLVFQIIGNE